MEPAIIRLASPADAQAMLDVYAPFVERTAATFEYEVPTVAEFSVRIQTVLQTLPWLVAETAGQLAGYTYATKHRDRTAYQWSVETSVYVHPDFQGKGIAKRLYDRLFELLTQQGYVNTYAGITLPNPPSERLHVSLGFEPVGVYKKIGYKLGCWYDVQWLVKTLRTPPDKPSKPVLLTEIIKPGQAVDYKNGSG